MSSPDHHKDSDGSTSNGIVVATEGCPSSMDAVASRVDLASAHGAGLASVHVVPAVASVAAIGLRSLGRIPVRADGRGPLRAPGRNRILQGARPGHDHCPLAGLTAEEIVAYPESSGADLSVVG